MALITSALETLDSRELIDAVNQGLLQQDRLLKLDSPLGKNALTPLRACGTSSIEGNYHWTVDVASLRDDTALLSLMHQPVTLWIQQGVTHSANSEYRPLHGFVHQVAYLGSDGSVSTYQLEFSSALVFLGKTQNDEGWLEKDARDIVSDVLNRYPQLQGLFRFKLTREPGVRSWCRQSESDLHFVHRLFEDEGWYCYWAHESIDGDGSVQATLIIVDDVASLPGAKAVEYFRGNTDHEADGFTQWAVTQTMQSMHFTSRSFDYKRPAWQSPAESVLQSTTYTTNSGRQSGQQHIPAAPMMVYEPTAYGYADSERGAARALRRVQIWDSQAGRYFGVGGVRWLDAGSRFTLDNHPRHPDTDPAKREFLVIGARWFIQNNVPIGQQATEYPLSLRARLAEKGHRAGRRSLRPDLPTTAQRDFSFSKWKRR
jgi:type VI secretion system secreted protein VgrG